VAALHEAEAAGPAGDLRDLPRVQVAALLAVELGRLGEEQRLARQVDAVSEDIGCRAEVGRAAAEALDLDAARRERHRAVENRDAAGVTPVQLAGEREHRAAAEGDDHGAGTQALERDRAGPVERRLALEEAHVRVRKRVRDQRQRLHRPEQEDVAVLAGEQQPRPGGPAFGVVRPLHLVEHQHLAAQRRHLRGAADDGRVLVDALLARHEPDVLLAELRGQAPMRFLREHPQRRGKDPAAGLGQELERRMRLARVRRADVRDDGVRLERPRREDDLRVGHASDRCPARPARRATRPLLPAAVLPSGGHSSYATRAGSRAERSRSCPMTAPDALRAYESALATQDWKYVEPLMHADVCVTFSDGSHFRGREEVRTAFERNFSLIEDEQYAIRSVHWIANDPCHAVCTYEFQWSGLIGGNPARGEGRGTSVLTNDDGTWLIVAEHLGPLADLS
jgi:ketosteroid isomerase-like protein